MKILGSDWHWADGSTADRADYEQADRILNLAWSEPGIDEIILAGDWLEYWKCGWIQVITHNKERLRALSDQLLITRKKFTWVLGNHDWQDGDVELARRHLRAAGWTAPIIIEPSHAVRGKWRIEHGNDFDPWNVTPFTWQTKVARWLTYGVGAIERKVVPDLDERKANPLRLVSPAAQVKSLDHDINSKVNHWAAENHAWLIFGHTHYPYELVGDDWGVANTGCCTVNQGASYVLLDDNGEAHSVILKTAGAPEGGQSE